MINWGLIEATLDSAISDAECALAQRRKDYAGFEHVADLPQHEEELQDARRARAELAALKARIAEAPYTLPLQEQHTSSGELFSIHAAPLERLPHAWVGHRVRLLLDDEAKS